MSPSAAIADSGEIPFLRLPTGPVHFRRRAERLGALAPGHAAGDVRAFLAGLAAAQAQAWERIAAAAGPMPARSEPPPATWREALATLLERVNGAPAPPAAHAAVARLRSLPGTELDALAARVRSGEAGEEDAALAPFVGAALQVLYTAMASRVAAGAVPRPHDGLCPVCGSPAVAGVVLADGGLRYLACSMCGTEWHRTRVQCVSCGEGGGLAYFAIDPGRAAVKAEACSHCRTFIKLFYLEQDPLADPFADDIATLALDLRLAGEEYARGGVNCFWA